MNRNHNHDQLRGFPPPSLPLRSSFSPNFTERDRINSRSLNLPIRSSSRDYLYSVRAQRLPLIWANFPGLGGAAVDCEERLAAVVAVGNPYSFILFREGRIL